jgi:hypothetical protein
MGQTGLLGVDAVKVQSPLSVRPLQQFGDAQLLTFEADVHLLGLDFIPFAWSDRLRVVGSVVDFEGQ